MADTTPIRLDRYELRERIGAGGTARVYKAYDTTLEREVAIKVLYEHLAEDAAFQERFEREAKLVAAFNHPNIVQVYDFSAQKQFDRAIYYMVMSYIPGHTLRQELERAAERGERLPFSRILSIMRHIASALGYAHAHGMVHRDVKPGNILIRPDGTAVLTDFGIARMIRSDRLTQQGVTSGTPTYMSPEQAAGEAGDSRSDLYALGIILYEMLSGSPPFDDDSNLSVMLKHMQTPVPTLPPVDGLNTEQISRFIGRALAKDPAQRFQSADQFITALERAFDLEPAEDDEDRTSLLMRRPTAVSDPSAQLKKTTLGLPALPVPQPIGAIAALIGITGLLLILLIFVIARPGTPPQAAVSPTAAMTPLAAGLVPAMTGNSPFFNTRFTPEDFYNTYWQQSEDEFITRRILPQGGYRLENRLANTGMTSIVETGMPYDEDISISMDALLDDTSSRASAYGIVFRYQDENNYNVFTVDGVGRYSIWTRENGVWRELRSAGESWTTDSAVKPIGEQNRLSVTILNNEIVGYVNSRRLVRVIETTFASGGVGIYLAADAGSAAVNIDRYRVFSSVPSMTSPSG
jgi:serine/threonine protein kinase